MTNDTTGESNTENSTQDTVYCVILDDITSQNAHFFNRTASNKLIPGENIYVFARFGEVQYSDTDIGQFKSKLQKLLTQRAASGGVVTVSLTGDDMDGDTAHKLAVSNSLFGYSITTMNGEGESATSVTSHIAVTSGTKTKSETKTEGETTTTITTSSPAITKIEDAYIYSYRHLENLATMVSGISDDTVIKAVQTADLTWTDSSRTITEDELNAPETETALLPFYDFLKDSNTLGIYKTDGTTLINEGGNYYPVFNPGLEEYDGQNHMILNTRIADAGYGAGLFAVFGKSAENSSHTIKYLLLKNTFITASKAAASDAVGMSVGAGTSSESKYIGSGTLAGVLSNTTVNNVLSYADQNLYGDLPSAEGGTVSTGVHVNNSSYYVVGGLVGGMSNSSIVDSASSIAVVANASYTGGLAGYAVGNSSISKCYAGGHTVNGMYRNVLNGESIQYNVSNGADNGNAGGLVGGASGTTKIENSYTTCSVSAKGSVGGFIGSTVSGVSIENSYCTGLIDLSQGTAKGPFAGDNNYEGITANQYLLGITIEDQNNRFTHESAPADDTGQDSASGTAAEPALADKTPGVVAELYENDASRLKDNSGSFKPIYRYDNAAGVPQYYPYQSQTTFNIVEKDSEGKDVTTPYIHVGDWQESEYVVLVVNTPDQSNGE